jgi:hypothetical protein
MEGTRWLAVMRVGFSAFGSLLIIVELKKELLIIISFARSDS